MDFGRGAYYRATTTGIIQLLKDFELLHGQTNLPISLPGDGEYVYVADHQIASVLLSLGPVQEY